MAQLFQATARLNVIFCNVTLYLITIQCEASSYAYQCNGPEQISSFDVQGDSKTSFKSKGGVVYSNKSIVDILQDERAFSVEEEQKLQVALDLDGKDLDLVLDTTAFILEQVKYDVHGA